MLLLLIGKVVIARSFLSLHLFEFENAVKSYLLLLLLLIFVVLKLLILTLLHLIRGKNSAMIQKRAR